MTIHLPRASRQRGFTLTELLVVIAILGILLSLLLPAIALVRRSARTAVCGNNQRQLALGFLAYGADQEELPSTYGINWNRNHNTEDEGAGALDSVRWQCTDAAGNLIPPAIDSPFSLAWAGDYVSSAVKGCGRWDRPPFGDRWHPPHMRNDYWYNGPGAAGGPIGNNSQLSGLFALGGYRTRGATHGFSLIHASPGGPAATALFVCPAPLQEATNLVAEPHGAGEWVLWGDQFDWPDTYRDSQRYNRNVTFGDGHARHVVALRGALGDL